MKDGKYILHEDTLRSNRDFKKAFPFTDKGTGSDGLSMFYDGMTTALISMANAKPYYTTTNTGLKEFHHGWGDIRIYIDIFKFDEYLQELHPDYANGSMSMKEFIQMKYGDFAVSVIQGLI